VATSRRCPVCKSETSSAKLTYLSGEEAPLAVAVRGMPVLECAQGHRSFAMADFPLLLLDHLLEQDEPKLPVSQAKGVVFKHYSCSACGAELGAGDDRPHTFHVDVDLPELPSFGVDLTLPVSHCKQCGREQLHSLKELKSRTPAALAHAFKAAQLAAA
jgi:predicted Zn-ribbon and HTH transcriptional regulator